MSNGKAVQSVPTCNHLSVLAQQNSTTHLGVIPPEILAQIFSLVCDVRASACPAKVDPDNPDRESHPFSKEPVTLSHVCSYWRQVAVTQTSLWSHIDVFPARHYDPIASERSQSYAVRSAEQLLDVHVVIPVLDAINDDTCTLGFPFLASIAPRMRSLNVQSASGRPSQTFCSLVVSNCLAKSISGKLTEVSVDTVVVPRRDLQNSPVLANRRDTIGPIFDEMLLAVTTLRLKHAWIQWQSKIYHGLTELRLCGGPPFRRSKFASILRSSPQLRVIELGGLGRFVAENVPIGSVRLVDLETLILSKVKDNHLKAILRMVEPGTRPLSLSIMNPYLNGSDFISKDELRRFVNRSNLVRLCATRFQSYSQLAEVLTIMPAIRVLAVDHFSCRSIDEEVVQSSIPAFDSLYVINSANSHSFTWPSIEAFVKRHGVQKLIMWNYDFKHSGLDLGSPPDHLHTICPLVKPVPNTEPNPAEEWS